MNEENITIIIGLCFLFFFGAAMYSSSNKLKVALKKEKEESTIDVKKGTYSVSPFEQICNECKLNVVKINDASQFTTASSVTEQEFPICYNYNKLNKKCCTIKKDNLYFGCPKFCFDNVKNSLVQGEIYTENDYKNFLRQNKYCNKI